MQKIKNLCKQLIAFVLAIILAVPAVYIPAKAEDAAETFDGKGWIRNQNASIG